MFNLDGIVLVRKCYITCVNLLFSNSRVQSYIKKGRLLDLRTEVQTVPPDGDVGHVGDVPVRRRWVQLARRPVNMIVSDCGQLGAVSLIIICRNNELILYVIVIGLTEA